MSTEGRARAWIEIEGASLRRNLGRIRAAVGREPRLVPIVKADGYGLGVAHAVAALEPADPWGYGVATVEEGRELRRLGVRKSILVLSPTPRGSVEEAVGEDLTLTVSDLETVERLRAAGGKLGRVPEFHVEVDTGMGRAGLDWRGAGTWGPAVSGRAGRGARWAGCFTHFHSADDGDPASVRLQWQRLLDALEACKRPDGPFLAHACNSAAALRTPEYAADLVRPGIFLYGGRAGAGLPDPEPVVSVRARIILAREVPPGSTAGYGATYVAEGWERWATVGIGYGDGLPRALSNRGSALVRGCRVPVVGRISMDATVVDITRVPAVEPGDAVTFVGRDGDERITLEEVAGWAGTINYEILTGLGPRLPRIWLEEAAP